MAGAAASLVRGFQRAAPHQTRAATRDPRAVRWLILGSSLGFFALFLLLPLITVFTEALRKGADVYLEALIQPDALSAESSFR